MRPTIAITSSIVRVGAIALALGLSGERMHAQGVAAESDAVFVRAQQMVTAGQDSAGRAVIDSVLAVTTEGTPRYAEALFWRATFRKTSAGAERDYRRIAVEYPLSPRAQEALFRLAQLEQTRGDRAAARVHLERIQREHPLGPISTRASVMLAELAFDDGDIATGCGAILAARDGLTSTDVELRNRVDYYSPRCANFAASTAARDSNVKAGLTPPGTSPVSSSRPTAPPATDQREYSVQVAAFETRAEADAMTKRLAARGFAVRVYGDQKPFRVRVGRYATKMAAANAVRQIARQNVRGIVVEAEPR
jgi:cell division septation protein DedD